ncbi:ATP-binding cassette sub-family A member 2-like [Glandiceps talaboti]
MVPLLKTLYADDEGISNTTVSADRFARAMVSLNSFKLEPFEERLYTNWMTTKISNKYNSMFDLAMKSDKRPSVSVESSLRNWTSVIAERPESFKKMFDFAYSSSFITRNLDGDSKQLLGNACRNRQLNKDIETETIEDDKLQHLHTFMSRLISTTTGNQSIVAGKPHCDKNRTNMAHVMKRLVDGELKFGYVPKTEAVEELIIEIENDVTGHFTEFFEDWLTRSREIQRLLKSRNFENLYYSIKNIQSSYMGNPERFKQVMKNIDTSFLTSNPTPLPEYRQLKQGIDYLDGMACLSLSQLKSKNKTHIFQAFSDEASAFDYVMKDESNQMVAVLVFTVDSEGRLPKHVTYKIRDTAAFNTREIRRLFWRPDQQHSNDYYGSGFLWLQDVVDRTLMKKMTGKNIQLPGSYVKRFPNPKYEDDIYIFKMFASLSYAMSSLQLVYGTVVTTNIVREEQQGFKQLMRTMGLDIRAFWMSWYLTAMIEIQTQNSLLILILKYGSIYGLSDISTLWFIMAVLFSGMFTYCLLFSKFFTNPNVAAIFYLSISGLTYALFMFIETLEHSGYHIVKKSWKLLISLLYSPITGYVWNAVTILELQREGAHLSNLDHPKEEDFTSLNFIEIFAVILIDAILFITIAAFYNQIVAYAKLITCITANAILKPVKCLGHCWVNTSTCRTTFLRDTDVLDGHFIEDEFHAAIPLIRCQNISKVYDESLGYALKNVTFDFYRGEITTLLGCNGVGKSTTISILANIISPTSGEVFIGGQNVRHKKTRDIIGFCPQRNALHESMTVEEHMWFYSRLGGSSAEETKRQVQEILLDMPLANKRQSRVSELSGGMKRMLSVAIAFIGKPSIVILDEPTASVDPYAKRKIWDLINKHRKDCTTILTTHCMQEAELLGDKVAILNGGTLQCHGSMNYLLNQLGYNYKLTIHPKNIVNTLGAPTDTQVKNDIVYLDRMSFIDTVVDIIHQELKDAKCELRTKELTVFRLSNEDVTDVDFQFDRVIELLLEIKDEYGIADFNFHAASLEDVFLTVTKGSLNIFNGKQNSKAKRLLVQIDAPDFGEAIKKQSVLLDTFFPGKLELSPPLELSASTYQKDFLYVPYANYVRQPPGYGSVQNIINTFWLPAGLGSSRRDALKQGKIKQLPADLSYKYNTINTNPADQRSNGKLLPSHYVTSGERLEDISGTNMTNYILSTYNVYKNSRYMALTFEEDGGQIIAQAWYSCETYHGAPFALNVLNNAILRANIDDKIHGDPSTYGITTISHPIDKTMMPTLIGDLYRGDGFKNAFLFTVLMSLLIPSLTVTLISERTSKSKDMQLLYGVDIKMYWAANFIWDMLFTLSSRMTYCKSQFREPTNIWQQSTRKGPTNVNIKNHLYQAIENDKRITVRNLTKIYRSSRNVDFVAVNCVSFDVRQGECLGLIGHNGSGKTTTLEMVTGFTSVTSGEIYINSDSICDRIRLHPWNTSNNIRQSMGYCPQFDALFEELTPREHFIVYGKLQNIPKMTTVITSTLNEFYLEDEADKPVKYLSGGNRRKLTAALAFYGDKSIVILDEVTNNMDPWNQRMMWNIIKKKKLDGVSIIMTTHSLGECERLCDRLVMLKNGVINRQGSLQEFKHNFNGKFIVDIFSSEAKLPMLYTLLNESFQPKVFQMRSTDPIQLEVNANVISVEELRKRLKDMERSGVIDRFILQEKSLEEAFIELEEDEYQESAKDYTENTI